VIAPHKTLPHAGCRCVLCSDSAYCSSAIGLLALQYASEVGVVLAILVINMLLSLTSRQLTLFEKHHTRSSEARTLAHRLFLAQFLNRYGRARAVCLSDGCCGLLEPQRLSVLQLQGSTNRDSAATVPWGKTAVRCGLLREQLVLSFVLEGCKALSNTAAVAGRPACHSAACI
jgi:hypothetical protein